MSFQKFGNYTYYDVDYPGANLGCIDTKKGLVLIDTPFMPDDIKKWQREVTTLLNKEIAYVINTHHHWDHILGNYDYSTPIIAHQLAYDEMLKPNGSMCHFFISKREDMSDEVKRQIYQIPIRLPTITFTDRMLLQLGDVNIELTHIGGHTESSICINVVEDKTLFTGDTFQSNAQPFMGQANFASWILALETILNMEVDFIIAGHGEIRGKGEVKRMMEFLQIMWNRVLELRNNGSNRHDTVNRVHDHLNFYPLSTGEEKSQALLFDEAVEKLYDQIGKILNNSRTPIANANLRNMKIGFN